MQLDDLILGTRTLAQQAMHKRQEVKNQEGRYEVDNQLLNTHGSLIFWGIK